MNVCFCAAGFKVLNINIIKKYSEGARLLNQAQFARQFYIASNYRTYQRELEIRRKPKSLMTPTDF